MSDPNLLVRVDPPILEEGRVIHATVRADNPQAHLVVASKRWWRGRLLHWVASLLYRDAADVTPEGRVESTDARVRVPTPVLFLLGVLAYLGLLQTAGVL